MFPCLIYRLLQDCLSLSSPLSLADIVNWLSELYFPESHSCHRENLRRKRGVGSSHDILAGVHSLDQSVGMHHTPEAPPPSAPSLAS